MFCYKREKWDASHSKSWFAITRMFSHVHVRSFASFFVRVSACAFTFVRVPIRTFHVYALVCFCVHVLLHAYFRVGLEEGEGPL